MGKSSSISTFSIQRPFLLYYYPKTFLLVFLRAVFGFKINKKGHLGGYHPPRMTCSTLLQQRRMTRTNLPAAKPYCSEHKVAQVACVVRTVRLPHPFSQTAGAYLLLLAIQHLRMSNQATRKAAAFVRCRESRLM